MKTKAMVAIDLGAESCRVALLRWKTGNPEIQLVHRFSNAPVAEARGLTWNIDRIYAEVLEGLRRCGECAEEGIESIGVDGWAVDYVRVKEDGTPLSAPFCYRDERTIEAQRQVHERIPPKKLYAATGIQLLRINTVYQLYSDRTQGLNSDRPWLNLPEYILHRLGGRPVAEHTNASHTQLVDAYSASWCKEIFEPLGLDLHAAPEIVPTGTDIGQLTGSLAEMPAFSATRLIAPACHDTACAIAGIPAAGNDWAFISSGTWSLVGTVLPAPRIDEAAQTKNFTNEGGIGGQVYFLKNVNGMWLVQQCMRHWATVGQEWQMEDLIAACVEIPKADYLLDLDDPDLLLADAMPARINAQLKRRNLPAFSESADAAPELANFIFHSLAAHYARVLDDIRALTGKKLKRLYIVGGGSKNDLLNELTAKTTDLEVIQGAVESSTLGNFAIQLAALSSRPSNRQGVSSDAVARWTHVLSQCAGIVDSSVRQTIDSTPQIALRER